MRKFETGATRDDAEGKLDYEGYLAPGVLRRYAEYMLSHQTQSDSNVRSADNWQKGIPKDAYMKSMFRHFMEVWEGHRTDDFDDTCQEALCALMFNVMGYLFEDLRPCPPPNAFHYDPNDLSNQMRLDDE